MSVMVEDKTKQTVELFMKGADMMVPTHYTNLNFQFKYQLNFLIFGFG